MTQTDPNLLCRMAAKYVWWKTPEEAAAMPERVVAQVMNLGTFENVAAVADAVGNDCLRHVLQTAEPGRVNAHYWHYRLGLVPVDSDDVPPMPVRATG